METRFKFRAWWPAKGKMYYDVQNIYDPGPWRPELADFEDYSDSFGGLIHMHTNPLAEDPRLILMQCTGFRDRHGELIYEGDIVKIYGPDIMRLYEPGGPHLTLNDIETVIFKDGCFILADREATRWNAEKYFEVIGNIWENQDLLKSPLTKTS